MGMEERMDVCYGQLETEQININTRNIDQCSTMEIVQLINHEDETVAGAVREALPQIAQAVDKCYEVLSGQGRIIYVGAGTSGRLGVLDASECIPTFGVSADVVQGCIAGGDSALRLAAEGCEDNVQMGRDQIRECGVTERDVVVGISASGSAAFVIGALEEAARNKAGTIAVVNNYGSRMKQYADICIEAVTGPEVISGSTRMKAGTAQKMILNMLSTATMIKMGKVYGNLMVDLKASNRKLEDRAKRLFQKATGQGWQDAEYYLKEADMDTKLAIFMCLADLDKEAAEHALRRYGGQLRRALESMGADEGRG